MDPRASGGTSRLPGRRRFLEACSVAPLVAFLSGCFGQDGAEAPPTAARGAGPAHPVRRTTEDRIHLALTSFRSGFHCSQSVLEAYADEFGLDPLVARRLAAPLAGGSTVGGECGAVTSGYLVLGLRHARIEPAHGDVEQEKELWDRVRRFVAEFEERHGALTCRELLGLDPFTREGYEKALRLNLFATRCTRQIRDAITILDSLG